MINFQFYTSNQFKETKLNEPKNNNSEYEAEKKNHKIKAKSYKISKNGQIEPNIIIIERNIIFIALIYQFYTSNYFNIS